MRSISSIEAAACCFLAGALVLAGCQRRAAAQKPPPIPVGWDAIQMWQRWPYLRIGARAYLRSTYDRKGGNEGADASHFLYQLNDGFNVTLDVEGAGVLYFERFNHWHGSPWHFVVDGADHQVSESSSADPLHPAAHAVFLPAGIFVPPVAYTWDETHGADLNWTPIAFARSMQLAYTRTHYGTGYYIYDLYVPGARLTRRLRPFAWRGGPPVAIRQLLARAGTDLAPEPGTPAGKRAGVRAAAGEAQLRPGQTVVLTQLRHAPAELRALEFSVPKEQAEAFGRARLRITWDGRAAASVEAPVALFFGAGTLYNRDQREYLVKAFPVNIRFGRARVHLACYFPMPFFRSARIELEGAGDGPPSLPVRWRVRWTPLRGRPWEVGYFHATYRDHPHPQAGRDLVLLDTRSAEGGGDWSGQLVGTSFIFSHNANLATLEGDPRFFFDDSETPQAQGTGTEEWAGGGDYWGGKNMTLPLVGHPTGAPSAKDARGGEDKIESAYRFLLSDLMPFGRNARIQLEHGGEDQSQEHYETVAYWYGNPRADLIATDTLKIGDAASERAHGYSSPQGSPPIAVTSRYERGVDHLDGREIYAASTDTERITTGAESFDLRLDPDNWGVMLRRKLDYSYPNQRAEVYVSAAPAQGTRPGWRFAGIWYTAGSNTVVYSNPRGELGATAHVVETSDRRFRDDEFLLPLALTRGRRRIRVRIRFTPVRRPLFPGAPPAPLAWSAFRYMAYCWVLPRRRGSR
ncbi:MAG: DUF2961 domain-containing protein [Terriglobales bacterium]